MRSQGQRRSCSPDPLLPRPDFRIPLLPCCMPTPDSFSQVLASLPFSPKELAYGICCRKFWRKQAYCLSCVKTFFSEGQDHHLPLYGTFKFTRCFIYSRPHVRPNTLGTGEAVIISSK